MNNIFLRHFHEKKITPYFQTFTVLRLSHGGKEALIRFIE